jgi:hypothetical protein
MSQVPSPLSTMRTAHYAHTSSRDLGGSAPLGPTDYHQQLRSTCSKCHSSSSTGSTPRGPNVQSPRRGRMERGMHTITLPPGMTAQTPSTAYARRQWMGRAHKPLLPLATRPHNGLRGYTGSPDGAAQPLNQRALGWRIPPRKTNSLPGVGSGATE